MKIAIVKTSALGDIVHASFVPGVLKKHIPDIQIDWVVTEDLSDILAHNPHIDNIITLPYASKANPWDTIKGLWQFSKQQHSPYDAIFDTQSLIKSGVISMLLSGKRIGFHAKGCRERLASICYNKKYALDYQESIFKRNLFLFLKHYSNYFKTIQNYTPSDKHLYYSPDAKKTSAQYLDPKKKNILLVPGASSMAKVYPSTHYANLIDHLDHDKYQCIITWGNDNEHKLAKAIKTYCSTNTPTVLPKRLNFDQLKALIDHSDLVIGADTGPVHMAWALNTPSIVLFATNNTFASSLRNHFTTPVNIAITDVSMDKIKPTTLLETVSSIMQHRQD